VRGQQRGAVAAAADPHRLAVAAALRFRWAETDRVALILAHRASGAIERLAAIDAAVEAASLAEPMRVGLSAQRKRRAAATVRASAASSKAGFSATKPSRPLEDYLVRLGALVEEGRVAHSIDAAAEEA
jgi:hypothetical protein